jgi:hypothetical protein
MKSTTKDMPTSDDLRALLPQLVILQVIHLAISKRLDEYISDGAEQAQNLHTVFGYTEGAQCIPTDFKH